MWKISRVTCRVVQCCTTRLFVGTLDTFVGSYTRETAALCLMTQGGTFIYVLHAAKCVRLWRMLYHPGHCWRFNLYSMHSDIWCFLVCIVSAIVSYIHDVYLFYVCIYAHLIHGESTCACGYGVQVVHAVFNDSDILPFRPSLPAYYCISALIFSLCPVFHMCLHLSLFFHPPHADFPVFSIFIITSYGLTLNGPFWCNLCYESPDLASRLTFMLRFNHFISNAHIKIHPYMDGLR